MIKDREMDDIRRQLEEMMAAGETRKVFSTTGNESLQSFCSALNLLLERQQEEQAGNVKLRQDYQSMLSNVSHDLKTPMTVVAGLVEMMDLDLGNVERNRALLQKIKQKVEEVNKMMSAFFRLNKLEAGDADMTLSRVNLSAACKESILGFYNMIQEQKLEANIQIPEEPIYIMGNAEALQRILNNLISNAIRYGYEGGVVGIGLSSDGTEAKIVVWDEGKGIEEKHFAQVFERLYTLEDSRNKNYQGSGLGLTISKRLVELQGGRITLKSRPYVKTTFTVTFPILAY